jgi:hypothetical protein
MSCSSCSNGAMHQPLLILDQNLHFHLQRSSLLAHSAFPTCNILVNASHDRLAHQPGPLLPSYSRPHIGQTDPFGPIARRQRPLSHMQQASPDLSSRTYVYTRLGSSPPHIYGISYVLLLAAIALPALVPTASSCHSLCGHEMIYAVEQLGETNNAPRRHWALDGGVRQFHGL